MSSIHLGRLQELIRWAETHERDKIEKSGLKGDFAGLAAAVSGGVVDENGIDVLLRVLPLFEDDVPGEFASLLKEIRGRAADDERVDLAAFARRFGESYQAAWPDGVSPERSSGKGDLVVPTLDDPRAVILPAVKSPKNGIVFVNGYNPVTREVSLMRPVLAEDGTAKIVIEAVNVGTKEKAAARELGRVVYRDGDTVFFANTRFEESTVYAVTFSASGAAERIERYPSYSAAGFEAPFKRSIVTTKPQKDKPNRSFFAKIFTDDKEYAEIRIFENADGEVDKITYVDLSRGELEKGPGRMFGREFYLMPDSGLKISVKKKQLAPGASAYQVHVYHDTERRAPNAARSTVHLNPVKLDAGNVDWVAAAWGLADGLSKRIAAEQVGDKALRDEFYAIRDAQGMRVACEVLMHLYYREATHMNVVNVLRMEDTVNLPVPPDTRVFPGSRDLVSGLINYFGHNTFSGFVTRQLLASAQELYPQIPARYIEGLWLYAAHPTAAESDFLRRGAGTPEELTEGYPVGKYRRILNETHAPFSDTTAARAEQRDRIRGMIAGDAMNEGFRQFLGYQLGLAENFDLLLLESGGLYYNNKLVHSIGVAEDGAELRALVQYSHRIVSIPSAGAVRRAGPKPVVLKPEDLAKDLRMAPHHPEDPFLFTFQERVRGNGGTWDESNMLIRGEDGSYRVPSASQVYDSMKGLLTLPQDYLDAMLPNDAVEMDGLNWTKGEPVAYELAEKGFGLNGIDLDEFPKFKMIPYVVKIGNVSLEVYLPQPGSKLAKNLRDKGYYVATEEDLPKIVKYYLQVTKKGFVPTRANIYLMPGLMEKGDGGILGFYTWKTEDLVISSEVVGSENSFEKWAAIRLFNTARHEIAHSVKRGNPWITSLMYRAMALDGFTMDYGNTHLEEYFAVLTQHYFDHPIHRRRFPNGYRLLYTLIKLKEAGVSWEGPNHDIPLLEDPIEDPLRERNIDGTYGALRTLALGGDPFAAIAAAKSAPGGDKGGGGGTGPAKKIVVLKKPRSLVVPKAPAAAPHPVTAPELRRPEPHASPEGKRLLSPLPEAATSKVTPAVLLPKPAGALPPSGFLGVSRFAPMPALMTARF